MLLKVSKNVSSDQTYIDTKTKISNSGSVLIVQEKGLIFW